MIALEIAGKEGHEAVLEKIRKAGIWEYGIYQEKLADKLIRIRENHRVSGGELIAAGALNNQDLEQQLLNPAVARAEDVIDGLAVIAMLVAASHMILYIPEGKSEFGRHLKELASATGIELHIKEGLADMRSLKDGCVCHLETLLAVSDVIKDCWQPGAYVCTKVCSASGAVYGEVRYAAYDTVIETLFTQLPKQIKAVHIGTELYDSNVLKEIIGQDRKLGNGVITVFDSSCCMVSEAEKNLREYRKRCCGKCTFCREGLLQLYMRIHEITLGKGEWPGLEIMKEIGDAMGFCTVCSVGETGAAFTLETFKKFENEYEDHIRKRKCTAEHCTAFVNTYIDPLACTGCGDCIKVCPVNCIEGLSSYIHIIEDMDCIGCKACMDICQAQAVVRTVQTVPRLPDRLTRTGRFKRY